MGIGNVIANTSLMEMAMAYSRSRTTLKGCAAPNCRPDCAPHAGSAAAADKAASRERRSSMETFRNPNMAAGEKIGDQMSNP